MDQLKQDNNLQVKNEIKNPALQKISDRVEESLKYSQFLGFESICKCPDTLERGQITHHCFYPRFVLLRKKTKDYKN